MNISRIIKLNKGWIAVRVPEADILSRSDDAVRVLLRCAKGVFVMDDYDLKFTTKIAESNDLFVVFHESNTLTLAAYGREDTKVNLTGAQALGLLSAGNTVSEDSHRQQTVQESESEKLQQFKATINDVHIEGRYLPMPHQYKAALFKAGNRRAFDLSTMRTGKTGSTMLALEYLFRKQRIRNVLILAPLSCVRPVWTDAIKDTMPAHIAVAVTGTKAQRLRAFKEPHDIIVTNYESIKLHPKEYRDFHPDAIVIDECTHYANAQSARSKAIKQFIKDVNPAYVWGLTGTPGYDPIKAFAMSKLINPSAVGCNTMTAWKDLTMYRYGPEAWQWKNRDCAPDMIKKALSPAILFRKDDLFDLPPVAYIAREAEYEQAQLKLMNKLREDMCATAESGEVITAQQKSVLVSKLLQCAAGAVYDANGNTIELDNTSRVSEIMQLIGEATGKTVIFSPFTGCIHKLYDSLTSKGVNCAVVEGATTEKQRGKIFHDFQYVPKGEGGVDVLIAHPRTTAFGVELAAADMMIFDGAPLSGDFVFGQAVERLSSLKQKAKQITIAQVYTCAEERKVFNALIQGQSLSNVVADLFRDIVR